MDHVELAIKLAEDFPNAERYEFENALGKARDELRQVEVPIYNDEEPIIAKLETLPKKRPKKAIR